MAAHPPVEMRRWHRMRRMFCGGRGHAPLLLLLGAAGCAGTLWLLGASPVGTPGAGLRLVPGRWPRRWLVIVPLSGVAECWRCRWAT